MPDEFDAQLLRRFADAREPLADVQFVAQVTARLPPAARLRLSALWSVPGTILGGLATGISASLRLRHAGLMAVAAAVVTLWAAFV